MTLQIHAETVPLEVDSDGVVRVGRTRVTLDSVIYSFNQGATAEEIAQQYPALNLADIYGTIAYYLRFSDEVDAYLNQRQQETARIQQENEARFNPVGIRERLLARKSEKE
ncbi:MAG: DUF433 domain-containing protein [Chloroflexi bacterium]|nr:DUF433 domain-containing protein [Chloroflexota bacterium]